MIKLENTEVIGWEHAIRGMRNPMNSWDKSDSYTRVTFEPPGSREFVMGPNDHDLAMRLAKGGSVHAKYRRMIAVYVDITAPLYWWKEFDTYKVGTVANSCSTMHKIHARDLTLEDFSCEHLSERNLTALEDLIYTINISRAKYAETGNRDHWREMIQLLPTSYNQKRTVMLNYEVLVGMYRDRKNHKLDEWVEFCKWIENLPYAGDVIIT